MAKLKNARAAGPQPSHTPAADAASAAAAQSEPSTREPSPVHPTKGFSLAPEPMDVDPEPATPDRPRNSETTLPALSQALIKLSSPAPSSKPAQVTTSTVFRKSKFPTYDPAQLTWNEVRTLNDENTYCYCGKDRYLDVFMVQCHHCKNWFHEGCISVPLGPTIPLFTNYTFTCAGCSTHPEAREIFTRTPCAWKDVVTTAMANMMMQATKRDHDDLSAATLMRQPIKPYYFVRDEVVDFVDANWVPLWGGNKAKVESVWKGTLSTTLYQYREVFITNSESRVTLSPFTLFDQNLFNVRPGHIDMFSKTGINGRLIRGVVPPPNADIHAPRTAGTANAKLPKAGDVTRDPNAMAFLNYHVPITQQHSAREHMLSAHSSTVFIGGTSFTILKNRLNPQRKPTDYYASSLPAASSAQLVEGHPVNRDGMRYTPAELNPFLKYAAFRECNTLPCRPASGVGVFMSLEDRSPAITVSRDGLSCTNSNPSGPGHRTARSNVGVTRGNYYFEVFVDRATSTADNAAPHVRIGMCKREATLSAPVGYDDVGFAYRDATGHTVNNSRLKTYGDAYTTGDVIGVLVMLPSWRAVPAGAKKSSRTRIAHARQRTPVKYGKTPAVFFESPEYFPPADHPLPAMPEAKRFPAAYPTVPGSRLVFFKNGVCQGTAFNNLPAPIPEVCSRLTEQIAKYDDGTLGYYPAVSCYRGGAVTFNFGPNFLYPLPDEFDPVASALQLDLAFDLQLDRVPRPLFTKQTREHEQTPEMSDTSVPNGSIPPNTPVLPSNSPQPFSITTPRRKHWAPYVDAFFEHEVEKTLWDMVDEVECWHAYEHLGLDSARAKAHLEVPPPVLLEREDDPYLHTLPDLVFPVYGETYADHLAREERIRTGNPTLRDLLMMPSKPNGALGARRARVKWAIAEDPQYVCAVAPAAAGGVGGMVGAGRW